MESYSCSSLFNAYTFCTFRFVQFLLPKTRSEWSSSISIVSTQRFSHSLIHSLTHILLHWQYSLYEQFDSKCSIPCFNHLVMVNQTCFTHYIHYNEQIVYSPSTFPFVLIQISSTLLTRRIGGKKEETTSNRADNERLQLKWLVWIAETLKKISSNVAAIFSLEHEMFYSWRTHGTHNMSTGQLCTRISFPSSSSWVVTRLISTDYIFANSENSKNERGTNTNTNSITGMGNRNKHTHIHIWIWNVFSVHLYNFSKRRNRVSINN